MEDIEQSRDPAERAAEGKRLRADVPRSSHSEWAPSPDRADPVAILTEQSRTRIPELVPIRYGRMLASPFTFFRGAAAIQAADLAQGPRSGPWVQLCGDAHLSNFGGFAAPDRDLVFDVNDFDETLPGPWEWDVKRLATSLAIAGRDHSLDPGARRAIVLDSVRAYRTAMAAHAANRNLDVWYARLDLASITDRVAATATKKERAAFDRNIAKSQAKDSLRALSKLTHRVGGKLRIISDPPLLVPIEEIVPEAGEPSADEQILLLLESYLETLPEDRRHLVEGYRYVHTARKVVGVGSVGTRAWISLFVGRDDEDPLFLQIKEAQASVLEPHTAECRFAHQGQRVVEGQRLVQAASDIFLGWLTGPEARGAHHFYVRQLWDQKASANVDRMSAPTLAKYGELCGATLARAHARSGDRMVIAGYLGKGDSFERAIASYAEAYADQNQADFDAVQAAVDDGRIEARTGV